MPETVDNETLPVVAVTVPAIASPVPEAMSARTSDGLEDGLSVTVEALEAS